MLTPLACVENRILGPFTCQTGATLGISLRFLWITKMPFKLSSIVTLCFDTLFAVVRYMLCEKCSDKFNAVLHVEINFSYL